MNDPESLRVFRYIRDHIFTLVGVTAALVVVVWLGITWRRLHPPNEGTTRLDAEMSAIVGTLYQYYLEYKEYPQGETKDIAAALLGQTRNRRRFLDWDKSQINEEGELLDPWRKPYRIRITGFAVEVRSAGPDLIFETKDDVVIKW